MAKQTDDGALLFGFPLGDAEDTPHVVSAEEYIPMLDEIENLEDVDLFVLVDKPNQKSKFVNLTYKRFKEFLHQHLNFIQDLSAQRLGSIGNVVEKSIHSGDVLMRDGDSWANKTLEQAGIASASHSHEDLLSAEFIQRLAGELDARIDVVGLNLKTHSHDDLATVEELEEVAAQAKRSHEASQAGLNKLADKLEASAQEMMQALRDANESHMAVFDGLEGQLESHTHDAGEINAGILSQKRGGLGVDVESLSGIIKVGNGEVSAAVSGRDFMPVSPTLEKLSNLSVKQVDQILLLVAKANDPAKRMVPKGEVDAG